MSTATIESATVTFLELELTRRCPLQCAHCYSDSGPTESRGSMTTPQWEAVIGDAAAFGVETVQFIAGGEHVGRGRYPIIDVEGTGELYSMLELTAPGIVHHSQRSGDTHTVWMLHPDGSWARATADHWREPPLVHQTGPRRLWDILDDLREHWLARGYFWLHGARVHIDPIRRADPARTAGLRIMPPGLVA